MIEFFSDLHVALQVTIIACATLLVIVFGSTILGIVVALTMALFGGVVIAFLWITEKIINIYNWCRYPAVRERRRNRRR